MHEKLLVDAGLTQNEAKVYLTLLKIGRSQSGKIVQQAKVAGGKIYETLNKLIDKGLVEIVMDNGIKQFSAADPETILLYMEDKKKGIEEQTKSLSKVIPELQKIREQDEHIEKVYLVKGFRGIKPIVYKALEESSSEIKIMGVRSSKDPVFNRFWEHWHRERVKQKKNARLLFTDKETPYWYFYHDLKHTKIKYAPSISPSATMIMGDNCFFFSYDKRFICIHIRSSSIAKSYSSFFEDLWGLGKS